jgi:hypothetical protein
MAQINDVTTATPLAIDLVSKAARVTLYHSNGVEMDPEPTAEAVVTSGTILTTAALTLGSGILAIRNGASRKLKLVGIEIMMSYSSIAAATVFTINMLRNNAASTTATGGSTLAPWLEDTTGAASTIADSRVCLVNTALTITGLTSNAFLGSWHVSRAVTGQSIFLELSNKDYTFQPNEGVYFILGTAGAIGDAFSINCYFKEY